MNSVATTYTGRHKMTDIDVSGLNCRHCNNRLPDGGWYALREGEVMYAACAGCETQHPHQGDDVLVYWFAPDAPIYDSKD
jgi:hypothetical protein